MCGVPGVGGWARVRTPCQVEMWHSVFAERWKQRTVLVAIVSKIPLPLWCDASARLLTVVSCTLFCFDYACYLT